MYMIFGLGLRREQDANLDRDCAHRFDFLPCDWYSCDCPCLVKTSCYKYLGVHIDDKLNWSEHIRHTVTKLRQTIAQLYFVRFLNTSVLKILYLLLFNRDFCMEFYVGEDIIYPI